MIKVFLEKIEKQRNMRRMRNVFELVRRKFHHDNGIRPDLFYTIKGWNTNISNQECFSACIFQDMINKARSGAFPFCSGYADSLMTITLQKNIGL